MSLIIGSAVIYGVMSSITFVVYARDKRAARRAEPRTPEKTLHLCELAGGWPGAFVAQRFLRHKNAKFSYQVVFWFIVVAHLAAWGVAGWRCRLFG